MSIALSLWRAMPAHGGSAVKFSRRIERVERRSGWKKW